MRDEVRFLMRFYGQPKEKIVECCEKIMKIDKTVKSYKIIGIAKFTMNLFNPGECIEVDLKFNSAIDRDNFIQNIDTKRVYEEYAVADNIKAKYGKGETTLRKPGDIAFG